MASFDSPFITDIQDAHGSIDEPLSRLEIFELGMEELFSESNETESDETTGPTPELSIAIDEEEGFCLKVDEYPRPDDEFWSESAVLFARLPQ
jgi:hypothetical protein